MFNALLVLFEVAVIGIVYSPAFSTSLTLANYAFLGAFWIINFVKLCWNQMKVR